MDNSRWLIILFYWYFCLQYVISLLHSQLPEHQSLVVGIGIALAVLPGPATYVNKKAREWLESPPARRFFRAVDPRIVSEPVLLVVWATTMVGLWGLYTRLQNFNMGTAFLAAYLLGPALFAAYYGYRWLRARHCLRAWNQTARDLGLTTDHDPTDGQLIMEGDYAGLALSVVFGTEDDSDRTQCSCELGEEWTDRMIVAPDSPYYRTDEGRRLGDGAPGLRLYGAGGERRVADRLVERGIPTRLDALRRHFDRVRVAEGRLVTSRSGAIDDTDEFHGLVDEVADAAAALRTLDDENSTR